MVLGVFFFPLPSVFGFGFGPAAEDACRSLREHKGRVGVQSVPIRSLHLVVVHHVDVDTCWLGAYLVVGARWSAVWFQPRDWLA